MKIDQFIEETIMAIIEEAPNIDQIRFDIAIAPQRIYTSIDDWFWEIHVIPDANEHVNRVCFVVNLNQPEA